MAKIPLYFIAYFDFEVIKKSFESICKGNAHLEIIVIENKSPFTEGAIKPFFLNQLKEGRISSYYLFENNLANNAVEIVLAREMGKIKQSEIFVITDGDLLVSGDDWLAEELSIIKNNNDVFACGITLSMENLPLKNFPEAVNWVPADKAEAEQYFEVITGAHLLMFSGEKFAKYWEYRELKGLNFVDGTMHKYCYQNNQKWARTKISNAIHLTWDSYADLDHPYTKQKLNKSFKSTWYSKNYFSVIRKYSATHSTRTFIDWERVLKRQLRFFFKNSIKSRINLLKGNTT